jgi:hypothetical protein
MTDHLHKFTSVDECGELSFGRRQESARDTPPEFHFIGADIVALVLGEAVDEHGAGLGLERHHKVR